MDAVITIIKDDILIELKSDLMPILIGKELKNLGFKVSEISVVSIEESIDKILSNYMKAVDLVVLIGELDTVENDVVKSIIGDYLDNDANVSHQILYKPEIIYDKNGEVFGKLFSINSTYYIYIKRSESGFGNSLKEVLLPCIKGLFNERLRIYKNTIVYFTNKEELNNYLSDWESNLPEDLSLSYFCEGKEKGVRLYLSTAKKELESILQEKHNELLKVLESYISSSEDESLEIAVANYFKKSKKTISFAESCTGGRLSELFSSVYGSSAYFKGGVVTYSTQSKIDVLGVAAETIDEFTVVSEQVALEMAENARIKFKSDYAIATTGNAGPDKGDSNADIGTVYIGISTPDRNFVKKYVFDQPRKNTINSAVSKGLDLICKEIFKNK